MRFHLPALPGRSTDPSNSHCAYSQKVRKFHDMMERRGHECFIYEYEMDEAPDFTIELWNEANVDQAERINANLEPDDFLCIIGGNCQQLLADLVPLQPIEYGIGYEGTFSDFRVFESYAWMHVVYGAQQGAYKADGRNYDAVIPNYFEPDEFPFKEEKGDYLLYMGRMIQRKGLREAEEAANRAGVDIIWAGEANDYVPAYGEYIGPVGPEERGELMSNAIALMCPTRYIEPFGGVAVEAQLCGTPVISSDWGAFTETVVQGVTGYRCHTLGEMAWAITDVENLDPQTIRDRAVSLYSCDAVAPLYESYFKSVADVIGGQGWYTDSSYDLGQRSTMGKTLVG
jgi:glycosyltransferase involved in cell wall biosynthesis